MAIIHITRHGPRAALGWPRAGGGTPEGVSAPPQCGVQCTVGNWGPSVQCTVGIWVARQGSTGTAAGWRWPVIGCERSRKVLPHITTCRTQQLAPAKSSEELQ